MTEQKKISPRRTFLLQAAGCAGAGSLGPLGVTVVQGAGPAPASEPAQTVATPYQSLSRMRRHSSKRWSTFCVRRMNTLPASRLRTRDLHRPSTRGPYGKGDGRYLRGPFRSAKPELGLQSPLTPEQLCKAGIAAANAASIRDRGRPFDQLAAAEADDFLKDAQADRVQSDGVSLALWFNEVIYRLFVEACFADPMYGGNRNAVFWKMIGYPGLPATHALDMVRYRGKPYPGAKTPKSIADFT